MKLSKLVRSSSGRWISFALGVAFFEGAALLVAGGAPVTDQELKAMVSYDLGPAVVDVSRYPKEEQENYQLFQKRCSVCHTPARAINSPLITRDDWSRFINLMHARFQSRMQGRLWSKPEGRKILEFLVYDSHERKVERAGEFAALQKQLAERWDEVQQAKKERQKSQSTKPSAPYTGANP